MPSSMLASVNCSNFVGTKLSQTLCVNNKSIILKLFCLVRVMGSVFRAGVVLLVPADARPPVKTM